MKLVIDFEEFGGIDEFNGTITSRAEALIVNKAVDFIYDKIELDCDAYADYSLSTCDFVARTVTLIFLT